ncbi:MAG: nucleoside-diphosphate kinase [Sulfolobales archaeon]
MTQKREFLLIKPDGVKRGLVGEIIRRLEMKGFRIVRLKMLQLTRECAEKLYDVHKGKSFYEELVKFMTSGPVVALLIEGEEAIDVVRTMIGPTDGRKAPPGTIRGDFSTSILENIVHAADSEERAQYEASIVFNPDCSLNENLW